MTDSPDPDIRAALRDAEYARLKQSSTRDYWSELADWCTHISDRLVWINFAIVANAILLGLILWRIW